MGRGIIEAKRDTHIEVSERHHDIKSVMRDRGPLHLMSGSQNCDSQPAEFYWVDALAMTNPIMRLTLLRLSVKMRG